MGNRAVITTKERKVGVYLHWNGGRDSVEGFLEYCRLKGYRSPSSDSYGWARLCQVIGNYFGGTLSIGIDAYTDDERMDPGDNGIYVIDGWEIVERVGLYGCFQEQRCYPLGEMLADIDESQPKDEQLGQEYLGAIETNTLDIRPGDEVFVPTLRDRFERLEVVAMVPEGSRFEGLPMVCLYAGKDGKPDPVNPNNYLTQDHYRVVRGGKA